MTQEIKPQLVRAIGRWTLASLLLNLVIGSGIFGLPKDVSRFLGHAAPWAYLWAAAGMGLIMGCFAEVASQFTAAGGPYLYARVAFGRFLGIQMGWMAWLVRITSAAANANLFVIYVGQFWTEATQPIPRAVILTVLLGALAAINVRGVKAGATLSNFLTAAKLTALGAFVIAGLIFLRGPLPSGGPAPTGDWMQAILALVFAFGGFEAGLMAMAEVRNPRRDAPFALFAALAGCSLVYISVHFVVMWALADPGATDRPLAAAALVFLGPAGATLISIGALLSTYGHLTGQMVGAPRLTYALAEGGDFPQFFAVVHPKFRTPYISIVTFAVLVISLAIYGGFLWNAILSAVARLFTYGLVCGSLIVLRRRNPNADAYRLPGGIVMAVLGIAFCGVLVAQMNAQHLKIVAAIIAISTVNWLAVRRNTQPPNPLPGA
ncbi:MAG: APC family permease [Acidobacteria bacterium]|nr:APC family permease [Acidobacteriota bacterium]